MRSFGALEIGRAIAVAVTLIVFTTLLLAIGSTYLGDANSPYDMCVADNGRQLSCEALRVAARR